MLALLTTQARIETVRMLSYERNDLRVPLRRVTGTTPVFFLTKMSCDVDGSPNAYHPLDDNLALDVIDSAGGRRRGGLSAGPLEVLPSPDVVVYVQGAPFIQPDGEFKGYYVSETSYEDSALPATSPARYLDARKTQYIVLPGGLVPEAEIGDLAVVIDTASRRLAAAVFGDVGPANESGEASLATIQRLGLPATDGKSSPGQARDDLLFIVFPHTAQELASADAWPHAQATIDALAAREFERWGGMAEVDRVLAASPGVGSLPDSGENRQMYDELARLAAEGVIKQSGFGLPARTGGPPGRLPCAPEVAFACGQALAAAQRDIGAVERSAAQLTTLHRWPAHIRALGAILARFPEACYDEVGTPLQEQTRVQDLLQRVADLEAASNTHRT